MASEKEKLLILIKPHGMLVKPQQKTLITEDAAWEIEWSTSSSVPMTIDYFNLTVGRIIQADQGPRKIEECWRVTHIGGHARKLSYGVNPSDATSTSAKPMTDGLYVIKITGMSAIAEGMHVESGVGAAVIKLIQGSSNGSDTDKPDSSSAQTSSIHDDSTPARIVNETVLKFLSLAEDEEGDSSR